MRINVLKATVFDGELPSDARWTTDAFLLCHGVSSCALPLLVLCDSCRVLVRLPEDYIGLKMEVEILFGYPMGGLVYDKTRVSDVTDAICGL
jgi:hypothetical protein